MNPYQSDNTEMTEPAGYSLLGLADACAVFCMASFLLMVVSIVAACVLHPLFGAVAFALFFCVIVFGSKSDEYFLAHHRQERGRP